MKWRNCFPLYALGFFFLFFSCSDQSERSVNNAFYHWKNNLNITTAEFDYLSNLKAKKLYIRFFDVDWEGHSAKPLSVLEYSTSLPDTFEIVPTIFITNRTIINTPSSEIELLGDKIFQKIKHLTSHFKQNQIREIQFDCDWSQKSRSKYFQLLKFLRSKIASQHQSISTTIRLHQIKYFKDTGVPNVDRGVLMFYNIDDIDRWETPNSILNVPLAEKYLTNFEEYPLPLDLALPIFKWGIVFQDNKLIKIINNLDEQDLSDSSHFIKISENRFELTKSTYLKGYYLYKKDQIRLERADLAGLQKAADRLTPILSNKNLNLIFYHLDSTLIADFPHEALQDISNRFH